MAWQILALLSALFSASSAILEKKILLKQKPLEMSALMSLFALVLSIPFFFMIDMNSVSAISLIVLFGKCIIAAGAFYCVMVSIKELQLSSALPLLAITPALVAIFALVFLGESLNILEVTGMILIILGTYALELNAKNLLSPIKTFLKSKGYFYVLLALLLFTASSVLDKFILKAYNLPINAFMAFQQLFLALIFLSAILIRRNSLKETFRGSWKLVLLLAAFTIIYRYSQIAAVKNAPVALVLSIKRLSVFFAAIIGGAIFKEKNLIRKGAATTLIVLGTILLLAF
jgi:drug/metabolite transporter (DMT)-like permease